MVIDGEWGDNWAAKKEGVFPVFGKRSPPILEQKEQNSEGREPDMGGPKVGDRVRGRILFIRSFNTGGKQPRLEAQGVGGWPYGSWSRSPPDENDYRTAPVGQGPPNTFPYPPPRGLIPEVTASLERGNGRATPQL